MRNLRSSLSGIKALWFALLGLALAPAMIAAAPTPSVLICGGSMMNGDHFADSVLPAMREHYAGVKKIALVLHASFPADRDRMEQRLQTAFRHLAGIEAERKAVEDEKAVRRRARQPFKPSAASQLKGPQTK